MDEFAQQIASDLGAFHRATGLGSASHEAAICRHVAASFFRRGTPAFACVAYPDAARIRDGVTRDECDLVVQVRLDEWLWVEAKQIWKPGAAHWLWVDAAKDVKKLAKLRPPEATYVGLLVVGLDTTVRERFYLRHDIEGRFAKMTRLRHWRQISRTYEPRNGQRLNAWLWWRAVQ